MSDNTDMPLDAFEEPTAKPEAKASVTSIDAMIDRVLELDRKAAKAPWKVHRAGGELDSPGIKDANGMNVIAAEFDVEDWDETGVWGNEETADLIAEYRDLCPALAHELREIQQQVLRLKAEVDSLMAAWGKFKERTS